MTLTSHRRTLLAAALGSAVARRAGAATGTVPPAPIRTDWQDAARDRTIPVLIRLPARPGPAPTVLLSHGLGGSRDGLAYLGLALAESGHVAIHLQHHGSDAALWQGQTDPRGAMVAAVSDIGAAVARLRDVLFALDQVTQAREPALVGRVDAERIAIAGHSYGAWTVAHMLGERLPLGGWGFDLPDRRLRAGIQLSPIPPIGVPPATAFAAVTAPMLYVTGTQDQGWGVSDWRDRTVGYRNATAPAVLAVLDEARHLSFAGEAAAGPRWNDPRFQPRTARLATLFLQAMLRPDDTARRTLLSHAYLSPGDTFEAKGIG